MYFVFKAWYPEYVWGRRLCDSGVCPPLPSTAPRLMVSSALPNSAWAVSRSFEELGLLELLFGCSIPSESDLSLAGTLKQCMFEFSVPTISLCWYSYSSSSSAIVSLSSWQMSERAFGILSFTRLKKRWFMWSPMLYCFLRLLRYRCDEWSEWESRLFFSTSSSSSAISSSIVSFTLP